MNITNCPTLDRNPFGLSNDLGMSIFAQSVKEVIESIRDNWAKPTITFGDHLCKMIEDLAIAADMRAEKNWDGYGAEPANRIAVANARQFILSLPPNIERPDIFIESTGCVTFEWLEERRKTFSVTVNENNDLIWAGLFGSEKIFGVSHILNSLPKEIIENIHKVYS